MSLQLFIVYGLILGAVAFVARSTFRTWFTASKAGCGSGCGKCAAPAADQPGKKRVGLPLVK